MWKSNSLILLAAGALGACGAPAPTGDVTIVDAATIEFAAEVQTAGFTADPMAGYHLIVWRAGGAADHSLFVASVSDTQVLDALEDLGATPGDALTIASWDDRNDADASAPDAVIEGPPVQIEFVLADGTVLQLGDIITDTASRGFDMRLGGHRANIPEWHSGCVVCLVSCPGSKVGNASYTVRDFVAGVAHYELKADALPRDGATVTVRFRLGVPVL
jgi:hypothetical protein